jgi:hypothetical protein
MDYHESTGRFALAGETKCKDLKKKNDGLVGRLPLIMSYIPDSNGKIGPPDWGYTLALVGYTFYQISINKNGLHIVGLIQRDYYDSYVFFI